MVDRLQVDKCTTIKDGFCLGHMQRRTARVLLVTAMASAEEVERPTDHSPVWCCMWRARSGLFLPTHPASRKGQQTGDSHPRLFIMRRPLPFVTEDEGSHRRHMARRLGLRRCGRRCGCGNRRGSQGGRRAVGHDGIGRAIHGRQWPSSRPAEYPACRKRQLVRAMKQGPGPQKRDSSWLEVEVASGSGDAPSRSIQLATLKILKPLRQWWLLPRVEDLKTKISREPLHPCASTPPHELSHLVYG